MMTVNPIIDIVREYSSFWGLRWSYKIRTGTHVYTSRCSYSTTFEAALAAEERIVKELKK